MSKSLQPAAKSGMTQSKLVSAISLRKVALHFSLPSSLGRWKSAAQVREVVKPLIWIAWHRVSCKQASLSGGSQSWLWPRGTAGLLRLLT